MEWIGFRTYKDETWYKKRCLEAGSGLSNKLRFPKKNLGNLRKGL